MRMVLEQGHMINMQRLTDGRWLTASSKKS